MILTQIFAKTAAQKSKSKHPQMKIQKCQLAVAAAPRTSYKLHFAKNAETPLAKKRMVKVRSVYSTF